MRIRLNRREVLSYTWLTAVAWLGTAGMRLLWRTARPRPVPGQFGGVFEVGGLEALPAPGGPPVHVPAGRFWLVHTESGLLALDKVCPHLDCLLDWDDQSRTFLCPCHGSQFATDGSYLSGPAPRAMDRFVVRIVDEDGAVLAATARPAGGPIALAGETTPAPAPAEAASSAAAPARRVLVDTGHEIPGVSAL